ncbi:MAG: molecular chaperone Tir [Zetaproteobacteria bacterium]|nr:molecular chaperone Tir [Zetaproteobacteria bacterium]
MENNFSKVRDFLLEMEMVIHKENLEDQFFVVSDQDRGIHHMIVDCEHPILILEQVIAKIPLEREDLSDIWQGFLQINRKMVHGAFALDESGTMVIFRDTLRLDDLNFGELEASVGALSMGLAEHGDKILGWTSTN